MYYLSNENIIQAAVKNYLFLTQCHLCFPSWCEGFLELPAINYIKFWKVT